MQALRKPGGIIRKIIDWPFVGYVTTNYDELIELALKDARQAGWAAVGNSREEARKVSAGARRVVWHVHGVVSMAADRSHLVLTEQDYDDLYLDDSPATAQLRSLLTQHRVVFIGFGLKDPEVMRLLRRVGRLADPARPVFAFVGGLSGAENDSVRRELLVQYNVDVIPYQLLDGSHGQLEELLDVYGSMVVRRSISFNELAAPVPSYDPETTGLLIYDELCLRSGTAVTQDILKMLVRARVLSALRYRSPQTVAGLVEELNARSRVLRGGGYMPHAISMDEAVAVFDDLISAGLVQASDGNLGEVEFALTSTGRELAETQAGTTARLSEQFASSLETRARQVLSGADSAARVAKAAEGFLKECIERRALGVAMALWAWRPDQQSFHTTALLQSLPGFMRQLSEIEEAIGLIQLVQGVLSRPTDAERVYIGLALQAVFGVHLLGYDPDTVRARTRDLSATAFVADSSWLIPLLARSSPGHEFARLLFERLEKLNVVVLATPLLVEEVAEHARWGAGRVETRSGRPTPETYQTLTGRAGERSNAFLQGFVEEVSQGRIAWDFFGYLHSACGIQVGSAVITDQEVEKGIRHRGVLTFSLNDLEGFSQVLWAERDGLQEQIAKLRQERGTYRHERQVRAEAEVLLLVRDLRTKALGVPGRVLTNAYFLSYTKVIDEVAGSVVPVTMRPEAVVQWAATISPCELEEYGFLTNGLIWELAQRDLAIVDKTRLVATFAPYIAPAKEKLNDELDRHHLLISQYYGEDAAKAFRHADDLDIPIILEGLESQLTKELAEQLSKKSRLLEETQARARLTRKEQEELARFRMDKKFRKSKAKSKVRGTAARKRRKR